MRWQGPWLHKKKGRPDPPLPLQMTNILQQGKIKAVRSSTKEARRALEESDETCWTLDLSSPSTSEYAEMHCTFDAGVPMHQLRTLLCTFGGGFSPIRVVVTAVVDGQDVLLADVYPKDGNMPQSFPIEARGAQVASKVTLRLEGSTDGFGRVVVYHLAVLT